MAGSTETFTSVDGTAVEIGRAAVTSLESSLHGALLRAGDDGYDGARTIWNAMIDRRPGLIVRPADTRDVAAAVGFAARQGIRLSVRGGGHHHLGFAVCDGGITIDMRTMNKGAVDVQRNIAQVETGMTFSEFDALTHRHGRAATGAIVSMVGLPGYLLGGGIGWLHRKAGAGCDNIVSAELVTADGEVVEVDDQRDPDLLWALRGGGGNLGVVTRLGMRLHPVRDVLAGLVFFDLEELPEVAAFVDGFMDDAPNDLNVWMLHRRAPRSPVLPKSIHGRRVIALAVTYAGPLDGAEQAARPLRTFRQPLVDLVKVRPYPEWQQALDGAWGDGFHNEWVGHYLDRYDAEAMATLQRFVDDVPSPHTDVKLARLGGAFSAVGEDDTAFGFRQSRYALVIQTRWEDPEESERQLSWTREFHGAMAAHGNGKVYMNFIGQEPASRCADAYTAASIARLRDLKRRWDPDNLFRMNINIEPAS
ncbi:MAG: FAD-binding oxidoreductase [Desulfobacteraceae bacterium]